MEHMIGWVLVHHCTTRQQRERREARNVSGPPASTAGGAGFWREGLRALFPARALSR